MGWLEKGLLCCVDGGRFAFLYRIDGAASLKRLNKQKSYVVIMPCCDRMCVRFTRPYNLGSRALIDCVERVSLDLTVRSVGGK